MERGPDPTPVPPLPWGVWIAFAIFLIALAMPAYDVYGEAWSGYRCGMYIAEDFFDFLLQRGSGWTGPTTAALTIPNLVMILAPGLPLMPFRGRRYWPAIVATACAAQILHFRLLVGFDNPSGLRMGFLVWFASFIVLAGSLWQWEARVRRAAGSSTPAG